MSTTGFEYLYHGAAPAYVIRAIRPDLPQTVQSTLAKIADLSTVKVLDWDDSLEWSSQGDRNLVTLLDKFGRYQSSEAFPTFRSTPIATSPWTAPGPSTDSWSRGLSGTTAASVSWDSHWGKGSSSSHLIKQSARKEAAPCG